MKGYGNPSFRYLEGPVIKILLLEHTYLMTVLFQSPPPSQKKTLPLIEIWSTNAVQALLLKKDLNHQQNIALLITSKVIAFTLAIRSNPWESGSLRGWVRHLIGP